MTSTILIIDDDANIRETLQIALEDHGLKVITASNGEIGITRAIEHKPNLVLCDMMMPQASGFIVIERLKDHFNGQIPIIMLTGNDSDHQKRYAEFLGVDEYLTKPIRPFDLFQVLKKYIQLPSPAYALPAEEVASTPYY